MKNIKTKLTTLLRQITSRMHVHHFVKDVVRFTRSLFKEGDSFIRRFDKYRRLLRRVLLIMSFFYLFVLTLVIVHIFQLDQGFPQGREVLRDVAMVSFVEDHFPDIGWNPYWENGRPFFAGVYWGVLGVFGRLGSVGAEDIVRIASVVSILLIVSTFFGIAYLLSRRILLALAVPMFLLASPIFWAYVMDFGLHSKMFSSMLFILYIYVLLIYCSSGAKRSRELNQLSFPRKRESWILDPHFAKLRGAGQIEDDITSRLGRLGSLARRIKVKIKFLNIKTFIPNFKFQIKNLLYVCVILLLVLIFLSDFAIGVLSVIIFGGFVFQPEADRPLDEIYKAKGERLWFFAKTVGVVLGLSAFYLVPLVVNVHPGGILPATPGVGEPAMFDVLFKQAYPGPHFVALSLSGLLLLGVFIVRGSSEKKSDRLRRIFYLFAVITIFFLLFAFGYVPFQFGIAPIHIVYLITLFAVITITLGCSYLGKEAISGRILLVAIAALSAISLQNTKTLTSHRFQYPDSLASPIDARTFDTSKQYRVYYPPGSQSEQWLLHKKYDLFFTGGFNTQKAISISPFMFDWFAVREAYIYKTPPGSTGQEVNTDFDNEHFEKRGDYVVYKQATPIVYATNSQPVLVYAKDDKQFLEQLNDLADLDLTLDRVIPIRTKRWSNTSKIPIVSSVKDLQGVSLLRKETPLNEQKMSYKSLTQWEISLGTQYRGIVFKQTYDRNWKASLSDANGEKKLSIFEAGPARPLTPERSDGGREVMYVFLPNYISPARVTFTYQQPLSKKVGWMITILTLLSIFVIQLKQSRLSYVFDKLKFKIQNAKFKVAIKNSKF